MPQVIDKFDLILISDSGALYLIKMKATATGGHEPHTIAPLDSGFGFEDVPNLLRDQGATLAVMPDAPDPDSGVTCTLLNMASVNTNLKPPANKLLVALAKARRALRDGGTLTIKPAGGGPAEDIQVPGGNPVL